MTVNDSKKAPSELFGRLYFVVSGAVKLDRSAAKSKQGLMRRQEPEATRLKILLLYLFGITRETAAGSPFFQISRLQSTRIGKNH
jgi:hypothetical protein